MPLKTILTQVRCTTAGGELFALKFLEDNDIKRCTSVSTDTNLCWSAALFTEHSIAYTCLTYSSV